jgi:regulatory protein
MIEPAILHYCKYQERCHSEVRNKLYELGLLAPGVESQLSEIIEAGVLNEERFAKAYARGKWRMLKWGRNKIAQNLKQKKVSDYCIKKGLAEIDGEEYIDGGVTYSSPLTAMQEEIYNIMKRLDAEIQFHQQMYERQQKYEDELERTNRKKKNNYSSRVFYGISIIKFFSVVRKISVFTQFLNETKYLLEGLVCDGMETHVMDYLEVIKYDIQIEKIMERCKILQQQRFYDELLNDDIASKTPKKKSKKKSKNKEKNNIKKMDSPTSDVPEKLEWISKVNPSESTNSLAALMEDTTSTSDSSDGERWTHVNSTNSTKKKNKPTKILQKNNNNVAAVKKNVAINVVGSGNNNNNGNDKNVKPSNNVKQGLSFAQALLKNKQSEESFNVTDVVISDNKKADVTNENNNANVVTNVTNENNNANVVTNVIVNNTDVNVNAEKPKKQKQKKKQQQSVQPPPPPPPPPSPTTLPANRELTSERYFSRIPNYIHIPTYTPQNFYVPHDPNPNIPMIQQQPLLIPTIAYVPQMYSTPYHMMYPTCFY